MRFVQLNCAIVDADLANRQELSSFLAENGMSVVATLESLDGLVPLLRSSAETLPQLVLVNIDPNGAETLRQLTPLIREFRATSFFVMSQTVDAALLMDVIHVGAKEFIPLPMRPDRLLASIERIVQSDAASERRAKIIQVVPATGGCGATSVACNVAAALARGGAKTVIVDMDLICGSVATNFNLNPRYTIADVMISGGGSGSGGGTLDRQLVENALVTDPGSKLAVLARPEQPEDAQRVTRAGLTRLLGVLSGQYEYIVIDSVMSVESPYLFCSQAADMTVLVMELSVPAARNAERFIAALRRADVNTSKVSVVVNRFEKRGSDIKPDDVERTLGLKVAWTIPNDFKNAIAAINFGQPVVLRSPRAELASSIAGLAQMLNGGANGSNGRH